MTICHDAGKAMSQVYPRTDKNGACRHWQAKVTQDSQHRYTQTASSGVACEDDFGGRYGLVKCFWRWLNEIQV